MNEVIKTKTNKAALIRTLLKDKTKTKVAIANEVGCDPQYVYSVQNYDRVRARKLKAKERLAKLARSVGNKAKRKYVKSGKYSKKAKSPLNVPPVVKTQYIEVEVPQPHYDLTWKERFIALFFGRV